MSRNKKKENPPLFTPSVSVGFPSPAEEYIEAGLNLHEHLVGNEAATFFVRARGDSMINAGILSGDLLIVDRSLDALDGSVVVAALDGELTVKYLKIKNSKYYLCPANDIYTPIEIKNGQDIFIWGVVTHAIHKLQKRSMVAGGL